MDGANGLGSLNAGSMGGGMPDAFDANMAFSDPLASQQNTAVGGFGGHQGGSFMPFDPQPHGAGSLQGAHHPGHAGANGHGHPLDPPASMSGGRPTPSLHTMGAPGVPRPILSPTSFSDSSRVPTPLQPFPPNSATSGTMPFTNGFPMPGPSDGMGFAFPGAHGGMPPQHPMGGPSGAMGQMLPSPNGPMGMVPPQMHGMPGMLSPDAQMQQQMMMMAMMPAFPMGIAGMSVPPGMLPPGQFNIRPEDEREFARALHHGDKTNRTLRQVIDDFAQKRNQPPVLWKDFYLENIKRLQELSLKGDDDADTQTPAGSSGAATAPPGRGKSVKKPYFDPPSSPEDSPRGRKRVPARRFASDEDRKPSPAELRAASAKSRSTNPLKRKASAGSTGPGTSGRRPPTTSSRIGFAPTTKRLPLLQSNVLIPPVRSRSPTPPTEIVPQPGRVGVNMYTDADRAYFVDFIQFELTREPELSKHELCERLHIRAPHHSVESWKSHWSSRHAVADNILRLAAERVEARERAAGRRPPEPESDSDPPSRQSPAYVPRAAPPEPPPPKVKYETPSASEGEDAGVRTDSTTRSEDVMGGRDSQLTEADQRAMARYIATWTPGGWKATKNRTRWLPFGEKHPQRSADAWASHYTRRKKVILDMVKKYRLRSRKRVTKGLDPGLAKPGAAKAPVGNQTAAMRTAAGATAPASASAPRAPSNEEGPVSAFAAHPKSRLKHFQARKTVADTEGGSSSAPSSVATLAAAANGDAAVAAAPARKSASAVMGGDDEPLSSSMSEDEDNDADGDYVDLDADAEGEEDETPADAPKTAAAVAA